jgi:putative oxygen-independent coproporphyrinogen III oxidase
VCTVPSPPAAGNVTDRASFGIYVHFPWCLAKCPYCDFVSYPIAPGAIDHAGYAEAVIAETLARARSVGTGARVSSLFVGGGTVSLWDPTHLGRVIAQAGRALAFDAARIEITAECNPSSLDQDRARAMVAAGVNRLSVGVQALDDARLELLGRLHDRAGAIRSVKAAQRSGAARVSADLVYAVGGEKPEQAADEARALADLGITHLSAYCLSVEPGTRFARAARQGRLPLADETAAAESFFAIREALVPYGLLHYEISNYAAPGAEAVHNLGYWRGHDYVGLGCAAYGTLGDASGAATRYRNLTDPTRYVRAALQGADTSASVEHLEPATRLRERIMLGLRLAEGVDLDRAGQALGIDPWSRERRRAVERLETERRLVRDGSRLRIPAEAWIWADAITAALF